MKLKYIIFTVLLRCLVSGLYFLSSINTIVFDSNGGSGTMDVQKSYKDSVILDANAFI